MARIALIPARCGSRSIPKKNIKSFFGQPLIYWTAKAGSECSEVDRVVVATDCDEIEEVVNSLDLQKVEVYRRSSENATDQASTESVMLEFIEAGQLKDDDDLVLIQATSPLLRSQHLSDAFKTYSNVDSVLSCVRIKRFFWNEDGTPSNYDFRSRPRRQDFDGTLMENGAFYINSVGNIRQDQNRLSGNIGIYEMPEYTAIELDEPADWIAAEELMRSIYKPERLKADIKLVISDVDGVLTDAGMYYSEEGDELKKFSTHDGMGFQLLRERGYMTGIITSENTKIVERRAQKLKVDFLEQGKKDGGKLEAAKKMCEQAHIKLENVAYIGDDKNCYELLTNVGVAACPANALPIIKAIPGIVHIPKSGGEGAFRYFADYLINKAKD